MNMEFVNKCLYKSPYFIRNIGINIYGLYLYKHRFNKEFWNLYRCLKDYQYSNPEKMVIIQFQKLREMVKYAYNNTDYYRRLLDEYGIRPKDITSFEDFQNIPLLTRETIIKNFDSLISKNFPKKEKVLGHTSGTTGEKLHFYLPKSLMWELNYAHLYLLYSWGGIRPLDKRATIGARFFTEKPPYWSYNRFENQLLLSIHHLDSLTVRDYIKKIDSFKPVLIQGHPSGIHFIAQKIIEYKFHLSFTPKAIFTTGETLYPDQRVEIEEAFNTKIFETYGTGESVIIAGTCVHNCGFHELSDYGYMELLPTDEIVGTSLYNEAMPFIRYKIGDMAEPVKDIPSRSCKVSYPVKAKKIIGRIDDRIVLPNGKVIFPVTIRMKVKSLLHVGENYQLIQHSLKELESILQLNNPDEERVNRLKEVIEEIVKDKYISLEVKLVEKIDHKGKMRNIISEVKA